MKYNLRFLFAYLLCGFAFMAFAQEAETVTESTEVDEDIFIDGVVTRTLIQENRVLPWEPIREADIAWEKRIWRVIDTREKMNLPFRYPEKPFVLLLKELAEQGELVVFRDEKFKEKLSPEELQNIFSRPDTITKLDYETYEQTIEIVTVDINPEDINRFRVKEVWFFDEETSRLRNRILGIAPVKETYDEDTGLFKYEQPIFWIYYPAVREAFSKHKVFNDFNDAGPTTWYDLFEQRKFASYISKISNVNDMRVKDYFETSANPGIDMLLESDRIKQELFNFEHDLWEY
jgi:gliding motility associated protien GldN